MMEYPDPYAYRRLFNLSMSYGGVLLLLVSLGLLRPLLEEPAQLERWREAAGSVAALLPVGMGFSALAAGVVRKLIFRYGGINRKCLLGVFLVGSFWQLPLSLGLAAAAASHEPRAWELPLVFTGGAMLASAALVAVLHRSARASTSD